MFRNGPALAGSFDEQEQGVSDAAVWLAEEGGAPLAAITQAQSGSREEIDVLLALLARPDTDALLKTADRLQKVPATRLVTWLQRWLFDLISIKLAGKVRYYPAPALRAFSAMHWRPSR